MRTSSKLFQALLLGLIFSGGPVSAQDSATLSVGEMRVATAALLEQGQSQQAYRFAGALLERDPDDIDALLLRSRAARNIGRMAEARRTARRAWELAETDDFRFAAALANAQALATQGARTRAQLWLRRAAQVAPNDRARALARRDFQYVRSRNKWATQLSFNIAPSSNINNGSTHKTSRLFDLPFEFTLQNEALALSGTEISFGFDTRYRVSETRRRALDLTFGADHTTFRLSDDAKDRAPDAKGSDFAQTRLDLGLRQQHKVADNRGLLSYGVGFGRLNYAGEPLYNALRANISYRHALSRRSLGQLSLRAERQQGFDTRRDADSLSVDAALTQTLGKGHRLTLALGHTTSTSDADFLDYTQDRVSVRFAPAIELFSTRATFGLGFSRKDHDRSVYTSEGRHEERWSASATFVMTGIDYYGFVPTVTLSASRTEANLNLFETENVGIEMGIRSSF